MIFFQCIFMVTCNSCFMEFSFSCLIFFQSVVNISRNILYGHIVDNLYTGKLSKLAVFFLDKIFLVKYQIRSFESWYFSAFLSECFWKAAPSNGVSFGWIFIPVLKLVLINTCCFIPLDLCSVFAIEDTTRCKIQTLSGWFSWQHLSISQLIFCGIDHWNVF